MKDTGNTFQITKDQIKGMCATLKQLSDSYSRKENGLSDSEWLAKQYKAAFPNLSDKEAAELGNSTINGVKRFDETLKDAMDAAAAGKNREQWFSEKMSGELAGMDLSEAGERINALDGALLLGNQQMAEGTPIQVEREVISVAMPEVHEQPIATDSASGQWNTFTVKEALSHLGQGAALMGLQTMNHTESLDFVVEAAGETSDSGDGLKTLIEDGNIAQVKTLLTAALKIGADNKMLPIIPKHASVDTIANIASHGVEYISTMSKFSAGEITMMQAMNHVGLSGLSLLSNICSAEGIRNISTALLSQIPIIGPVLGNVVGGIIAASIGNKFHEKIRSTMQKVENTVRSAVNTAWNTIKTTGQKIKEKVKNFCQWLFA